MMSILHTWHAALKWYADPHRPEDYLNDNGERAIKALQAEPDPNDPRVQFEILPHIIKRDEDALVVLTRGGGERFCQLHPLRDGRVGIKILTGQNVNIITGPKDVMGTATILIYVSAPKKSD